MDASEFADELRRRAERYYGQQPRKAMQYARWIINCGQILSNDYVIGIGKMTLGDALHFQSQYLAAWEHIQKAEDHFRRAEHPVAAARTWVGRFALSIHLKRVDEVEGMLPSVQDTLERHGDRNLLVRFHMNLGIWLVERGHITEAQAHFDSALALVNELGDHPLLPHIYNNRGAGRFYLGQLAAAREDYLTAATIFESRDQLMLSATARMNVATIELGWGQYEQVQEIIEGCLPHLSPLPTASAQQHLAACAELAGNYSYAYDLIQEAITRFRELDAQRHLAIGLLEFVRICVQLQRFGEARIALQEAQEIAVTLKADSLVADSTLWHAQLELQELKWDSALNILHTIREEQASDILIYNLCFFKAHAILMQANADEAKQSAQRAMQLAIKSRRPHFRIDSHWQLSRVYLLRGQRSQAIRHLAVAVGLFGRMQRDFGRSIRRNFVARYAHMHTELVRLLIETDRSQEAFSVLETLKSTLFLRSFAPGLGRAVTAGTAADLWQRREDARNQLAALDSDASWSTAGVEHNDAARRNERRRLETLIRDLSQQLDRQEARLTTLPQISVQQIQAKLEAGERVASFFSADEKWWVFVVEKDHFEVRTLDVTYDVLKATVEELLQQVLIALQMGATSASINPRRLAKVNELSTRLGDWLLSTCLDPDADMPHRLTIVPFGLLHYVPFHILRVGERYLIEHDVEIVVNPAAGIILRSAVERTSSARILGYSEGESLPHVPQEVAALKEILKGESFVGENAQRQLLNQEPTQILHLAAHALHRGDQPQRSYIVLADGNLYAEDVLRYRMDYELVTLSACDTGRVMPSPGDDLLGVGCEFLRGGAGAVLASLWPSDDSSSVSLMETFYRHLLSREQPMSKAAALRQAQREMLARKPNLHPAFWGGFQISGDVKPLRSIMVG